MIRHAAWACLRSGSEKPLRTVDRQARELGLDDRDRALLRRIVGDEVRRRGTLRALVRTFARGKPKPDLVAHLHVGLVQLLFLDKVPDHAAVSETLRAVHDTLGPSKVKYANAVLREVARARREGLSGDSRRDLFDRDLHFDRDVFHAADEHPLLWAEDVLSLPAALMRRWTNRYGREEAERLARLALAEPALSVRVVRGAREELAAELDDAGVPSSAGVDPSILLCPSDAGAALVASAAFREGRVTVQGQTAMRAARLVEPREGELLLDLCAAPGGKAAVLAEPGARVLACDVEAHKLTRLRGTLERLRPAGRVWTIASDGARPATAAPFDGVLVDAPCSNTGVLAARPSARWRYGPQTQGSLAELQERLLASAAALVRPGGRLVWSTCSLEPEENERRVRAFVEERAEWSIEQEQAALPSAPPGPVDGGYACRLRRAGG